MKILVCCRAIDNMAGGVERMASALMNNMVERGHTIGLMTLDQDDATSYYTLDEAIEWYKVAVGNPARKATIGEMLERAKTVRKIVKRFDPDVMIGFQDGPYVSNRVYTIGMGYPIILAERNAPTRYDHIRSGKHRHLIYQFFRFAKRITIQCESYRQHYPAYLHKKIVTIPNPVFPADPAFLGWEKHRKVLLSVGRLEFQKNYAVLVNAFAEIADKHREWILRIVGEGVERKELEALVLSHGLKERVEMPGTNDNICEEYAKASLFCLSSRFEGFPNAQAEAMAHGLPCVGFEGCSGVSDLIEHGQNGRLAKGNGDSSSLAKELDALMSQPEALKKAGKVAQDSVKEYNPEHIYDLWEQVFTEAATR